MRGLICLDCLPLADDAGNRDLVKIVIFGNGGNFHLDIAKAVMNPQEGFIRFVLVEKITFNEIIDNTPRIPAVKIKGGPTLALWSRPDLNAGRQGLPF